jgi:ureidoacrylate peracid hydrolase
MNEAETRANRVVNTGREGSRAALLVIDPVNDFLSEGGAAWPLTKSTVEMNEVVPNLKRLMAGVRERGVPILIGPMAYTEEDYRDSRWHQRSGINRIMFERKMFLAGSWGADFHPELTPAPTDVILEPHKGTDVFETDLPKHLEKLGVSHLIIAGMTANLCCESTGRHAMEHGYDVTFVSDAIGAENIPAYEASIRVNYPLISNGVMKVDEVLSALDFQRAGKEQPQEGDHVFGSDHGDVGKVGEVVRGKAEMADHVVVPRGVIFDKNLYIPLEAFVRRFDGGSMVNVPKLVIDKMGWDEPPTLTQQRQKDGPAEREVNKLYRSSDPSGAELR